MAHFYIGENSGSRDIFSRLRAGGDGPGTPGLFGMGDLAGRKSRNLLAATIAAQQNSAKLKPEILSDGQKTLGKINAGLSAAGQARSVIAEAEAAAYGGDAFSLGSDGGGSVEIDEAESALQALGTKVERLLNEVRSTQTDPAHVDWNPVYARLVEIQGEVNSAGGQVSAIVGRLASAVNNAQRQADATRRKIAQEEQRRVAAERAEAAREAAKLRAEEAAAKAAERREQAALQAELQREQRLAQAELQRETARAQMEAQLEAQRRNIEAQRAAAEQAAMQAQLQQEQAAQQAQLQAELAAQAAAQAALAPPVQQVQYQQPQYQYYGAPMSTPAPTSADVTYADPSVIFGGGGGAPQAFYADPTQVYPAATDNNWLDAENAAYANKGWQPGNEMFGLRGMRGLGEPAPTTSAGNAIRNLLSPENVNQFQTLASTFAPKYFAPPPPPPPPLPEPSLADLVTPQNVMIGLGAAAAYWYFVKKPKR